jgi:hypothetical protein
MAAEQQKYVHNLKQFHSSLQPCNVAFLFFYGHNPNEPCIVCRTKKYALRNSDFYIVQGIEENYLYAYSTDNVKFLVANCMLKENSPAAIYSDCDEDSEFLGNHLEFSIMVSRKTGPFFKIHYTEYEASGDPVSFQRNTNECNIDIDMEAINGPLSTFKSQSCFHNKAITLGMAYADKKYRVDLIQKLASVAINGHATKLHGGTPFTVPMKKYKNVHIGDPVFYNFILAKFFNLIKNDGFEYATMILDLQNNKTLFIWIHLVESKGKIVMVNTHKALKAAFALSNMARASKKEHKCLETCSSALQTIANEI